MTKFGERCQRVRRRCRLGHEGSAISGVLAALRAEQPRQRAEQPPLRAQKRKREKMVSVVSRRHQLLSAEVPSRDASSFRAYRPATGEPITRRTAVRC
jgi:hypothetical protein